MAENGQYLLFLSSHSGSILCMADWPKTIFVKGIGISIASWEELDELIERYGSEGPLVIHATGQPLPRVERPDGAPGVLTPSDRSLLQHFVTEGNRGVLSSQIGQALGTAGRGIPPALDAWARRIGLVTQEGATAFESIKRTDGRGFRLTQLYLNAARTMVSV
jgi:hypothetical protein